jgi:hypothetical protein
MNDLSIDTTVATTTSYSPDGATIGYTVKVSQYPVSFFVLILGFLIMCWTIKTIVTIKLKA